MKQGIYPVVHTPLNEDESVDFEGLEECITYYNRSPVPGVTLLGSGGELPYFSDTEQRKILQAARSWLNADKSIIAGVHAHSSKQAVDKISSYSSDVDYVLLLLADYYLNRFSDYFEALQHIAKHTSKPILFYYFPQITGHFFSTKQLVQLLKINNIIGIKDSSLHSPSAKKILVRVPNTMYFSGLSLALEPLMTHGAAGAICPLASVIPQHTQQYFHAIRYRHHDIARHRKALIQMLPIVNSLNLPGKVQYYALKLLTAFPFPLLKNVQSSHAKVKLALQVLGVPISSRSRSPLPRLSINEEQEIKRILRDFY